MRGVRRVVTTAVATCSLLAAAVTAALPASAAVGDEPSRLSWWSSWQDLGGDVIGAPAAASWSPGHIDLFSLGRDGDVHQRAYPTRSGDWNDWSDVGPAYSSPAAISIGSHKLLVFARNKHGELKRRGFENGWRDWVDMPGRITGGPGADTGPDVIDVAARDRHGNVLLQQWTPHTSWQGWHSLGGDVDSNPAVVAGSNGSITIFARARHSHHLVGRHYEPDSGWGSWQDLGGVLYSAPAAVSMGDGTIKVMVQSHDHGLSVKTGDFADGFGPWYRRTGYVDNSPGATSALAGTADLFVNAHHAIERRGFGSASGLRGQDVAVALDHLGATEHPPGSNCTGFEPRGTCLAWCTYFATWVWHHVSAGLPYLSFSGSVYLWAKERNQWRSVHETPMPGDLAVYGNSPTSTVHTATVVEVSDSGMVTTVDGNFSDRVMLHGPFVPTSVMDGSSHLLGYASPLPIAGRSSVAAHTLSAAELALAHPTLAQIRSQDGGH